MRSSALPRPLSVSSGMSLTSGIVADGVYEIRHATSNFVLGAMDFELPNTAGSEEGLLLLEELSSSRTRVS